MKYFWSLTLMLAALVLSAEELKWADFKFDFKTDKPGAVYKAGETIRFSGNVQVKNAVPENMYAYCRILDDAYRTLATKKVKVSAEPIEMSCKLDRPGWVRMQVEMQDADGKFIRLAKGPYTLTVSGGVGAMTDPEKIRPGAAEPADFDAFWAQKRAELDKVPVKATRVPFELGKRWKDYYNCWDIKVDCAGGAPVSGYLCIPKNAKPKSLPVLVRYHGAGVRSASPVTMYRGVITLDVNAHGIENGKDAAFYTDLAKNGLKDYRHRGKLNRNENYFVGMYLRVMRSLDYVKTLPEWDGKTLVVFGGSQGGGQSLAAAALDKDVTHCVAGVPAICDHGGVQAGRVSGWPQFVSFRNIGKLTDDDKAVLREVAYIDGVNMARRIKAVTYIGTGFIDTTCVPTSVFAAYNSIPAGVEKHMTISPARGHDAPNTKGMDWISAMTKKSFAAEKK